MAVFHRILVVGDTGVGKTCLTVQLCCNHFVEEVDPTIDEDVYRKRVVIDDECGLMEIFDSATHTGTDWISADAGKFAAQCHGLLVVYSLTSRSSFERVPAFVSTIRTTCPGVAVMLVGNKSDLADAREVTAKEGAELAAAVGAEHMETSAKQRINVDEAFFGLVRAVRRLQPPRPRPRPARRRALCLLLS